MKKEEATDTISRHWLMECVSEGWIKFDTEKDENIFIHLVRDIAPSAQPDRDVIDDCLRHIHKNISVHTATGGVIAIRYYMEKLYEEIYGEGERPW